MLQNDVTHDGASTFQARVRIRQILALRKEQADPARIYGD